jgi:FkbM family methyltransferase
MTDLNLDGHETVTDHNGLVWENGGSDTDDHLSWGGHEPAILEIAKGMLPEKGCFLDVGAHVGLYTLNLAKKARDVYAIEANPKTYEVFLRNVARNSDKHTATIHGLNVAAWDSFTTLKMVDENDKETGGSTRGVVDENGTVPAMPLDATLPERCRPDFIKIDVEGAEAHVLRGLIRIVTECRPKLLIEMHDMYFGPQCREETIQFLADVGYEWNDSLKYGGGYYIVAHPPITDFEIEVVKAGQ